MLSDHDEVPVPPSPLLVPIICGFGLAVLVGLCREELRPRRVLGRLLWLQRAVRAFAGPPVAALAPPVAAGSGPVKDGCMLVRATAFHDGTTTDCRTFQSARQQAQLGRRVLVVYRLSGAAGGGGVYQMMYNPHRLALDRPVAERFPPHAEEWGRGAGGATGAKEFLSATLTTHHPDGSTATHDVTDMLRRVAGPLGDFHARAGATITAFSFVPDLRNDVIAASLVYYDEEGTEHQHTLPFSMDDPRADAPDAVRPLGAGVPDAPVFPSSPAARALAEPRTCVSEPSSPKDPFVVKALLSAHEARLKRLGRRRSKSCDVQ